MTRYWLYGIGLLFACALPWLHLPSYYVQLINLGLIFGLLSVSLNIVVGYAGQISLGHAGFFGIGAYTAALISAGGSGWLFWPGFVAAGLVTGLAGVCLGTPTLRLRGHYLALATLGFGEIMRQLFFNWRAVTHGMDGIGNIPAPAIGGFLLNTDVRFFYLALTVLGIVLLFVTRFQHSVYGLRLRAVRDAELAAGAAGVNVTWVRIAALTTSAVLAGLAGSLYAHMLTFISPDVFSFDLTAQILTMVVVGGPGTVFGPVLGAIALTFLPEVLRISNIYYQLIYGFGIILMIIFLPMGLGGWVRGALLRWKMRRFGMSTQAPDADERDAVDNGSPSALSEVVPGQILLAASQVSRRFGGLMAVDQLDLEVKAGTVHALIGPNGSGKSTFINLASGIYKLSGGQIRFAGREIGNAKTWDVANGGLVRTFQNLRLFSTLTVEENVMVGCASRNEAGLGAVLLGLPQATADAEQLARQSREAMQLAGVWHLRNRVVRTLPHELQRMVEIARALAKRPQMVMLDEPAAGLNPSEGDLLVQRIRRLRELGVTVLLVEHNMPLVMRVADYITVLNFGRKIAEGVPDQIRRNPAVIEAYLGRRLSKGLERHALAGA